MFLGFYKATALLLLCFSCHVLPSVADDANGAVADDAHAAVSASDDEHGCVDESVADVAIDTNDSDVTISLITITNNISNRFINTTMGFSRSAVSLVGGMKRSHISVPVCARTWIRSSHL